MKSEATLNADDVIFPVNVFKQVPDVMSTFQNFSRGLHRNISTKVMPT